jgi:hypothetical protein
MRLCSVPAGLILNPQLGNWSRVDPRRAKMFKVLFAHIPTLYFARLLNRPVSLTSSESGNMLPFITSFKCDARLLVCSTWLTIGSLRPLRPLTEALRPAC